MFGAGVGVGVGWDWEMLSAQHVRDFPKCLVVLHCLLIIKSRIPLLNLSGLNLHRANVHSPFGVGMVWQLEVGRRLQLFFLQTFIQYCFQRDFSSPFSLVSGVSNSQNFQSSAVQISWLIFAFHLYRQWISFFSA